LVRLTTGLLLEAYRFGFFPMAEDRSSPDVVWVKPKLRGVLPLNGFHLSRSMRKTLRKTSFEVRCDSRFPDVIAACAEAARGREETWLNAEIERSYTELFRDGFAHSVETYDGDELVGGLYGVSLRGAFFGESMFSRRTDASKIALCHLVGRLIAGGYALLDTQFITNHLKTFGAEEWPERRYQRALAEAMEREGDFRALPDQMSGSSIVQLITQTS
jgi:leucyl/phenylalanyl-tRNA--protein transferase